MNLTTEQMENIQIDYGTIFTNYGESDEKKIGPVRGGANFTASKNIRDIEYDGRKGKTKGMQVIDEINAMLSFNLLDTSLATLALALPQADYDDVAKTIKNNQGGVIPASKYLKNITLFGKTVGGKYKKITLYNALNEGDFAISTAPKAEGEVPFEVHAHWDPAVEDGDLFKIEDVDTIVPQV